MRMNKFGASRSGTVVHKRHAIVAPDQDAAARVRNFGEVTLGYSAEMAVAEALRCRQCTNGKAVCIPDCPLGIDIPKFVGQIATGNFRGAYGTISRDSMMPGVCGRVCPRENHCQARCVAGADGEAISVALLERFVSDWHLSQDTRVESAPIPGNAAKVAIVGSGPASLACAADLARLKYDVTVFEALHEAGGSLIRALPEFRLPKAVVQAEAHDIRRMGVTFRFNTIHGRHFTLRGLLEQQGFDAVFVGARTGLPVMLDIPGSKLKGVHTADDFLARVNLMKLYLLGELTTSKIPAHRVVVAGGGDAAIDCARIARRMGAEEVTVVYRRSLQELPARREEVERARQEGIQFLFLAIPIQLLGDSENNLRRVECQEVDLAEADLTGRPSPVPRAGTSFQLVADTFVAAVGQTHDPNPAGATAELNMDRTGRIEVDLQTRRTSIPGVFACTRIGTGSAVIPEMADGRAAARSIHEYLSGKMRATLNKASGTSV